MINYISRYISEGGHTHLVEDVSYYPMCANVANHAHRILISRFPASFFQFEARQTASLSAPPSPRGASSANETPVSYRRLVPPAFAIEPGWNHPRDLLIPVF